MRALALLAISTLTIAFSSTSDGPGMVTIDDGCGDTAWPVTVEGTPTPRQPEEMAAAYDIDRLDVDAGPDTTTFRLALCGVATEHDPQGGDYTVRWMFEPPTAEFEYCSAVVRAFTPGEEAARPPTSPPAGNTGRFEADCYLPAERSAPGVVSIPPKVPQGALELVDGHTLVVDGTSITVTLTSDELGGAAYVLAPGRNLSDLRATSRSRGLPNSQGSFSGVMTTRTAVVSDETDGASVTVRYEGGTAP